MLNLTLQKALKEGKNLLAFSAGVDSSALFFILKDAEVEFDIAIVDYGIREQSKDEVVYAKGLAKEFNKRIFVKKAPRIIKNFEANAREFRYNFFNEIITKNGYTNLITAHQLNDKLEWFLMRLSKGAGVITLSNMREIEKRDKYTIIRPLLNITKDELLEYLKLNGYKFFLDESNNDLKYERNRYREVVNKLLDIGNKDGFVRSFNILEKEALELRENYELIYQNKSLYVIKINSKRDIPNAIREYLKSLNYLVTSKEQEILKSKNSVVIGRKWAVEVIKNLIFITPYTKAIIPKKIKEKYRVAKIPPKTRAYLYKEKIEFVLNPEFNLGLNFKA